MISSTLIPKVSVIIPTWNRAKSLEHAIFSVLKQSFSNFEILVCDDGSTDNSEEIVRKFNDHRVIWIAGEHSGCPAVPRNRGLAASRSEWVAFLDSDDYWLPEKLEVQLNALEHSGRLAVCSNAFRNINSPMAEHLISWDRGELTFYDLLMNNRVVCSSMLISRKVLDITGGFPEERSFKVGEDYSLWLKVSQLTSIVYLDSPLVVYKDDPKNSIRAKGPSIATQRRRVFSNYLIWQVCRKPLRSTIDLIAIVIAWCLSYVYVAIYRLFAVALNWRHKINSVKVHFFSPNVNLPNVKENSHCLDTSVLQAELLDKKPLLSVLLPVHNSSAYLRQSIYSILNQTYQNFELIVVDDGSTDGSKIVLDDIVDSRIIRVTLEKRLGIVAALNAALMKAQGVYIARMDADDIALSERLSRQVDFLNQHLDVAIVGTWIKGFGELKRSYVHRYPASHPEIKATLLFENPIAHQSVMIRRSAMDLLTYKYSSDFPFVEDWELWARVVSVGKAANISEVLIQYRIHSTSSSHLHASIQKDSKYRLLERMFLEIGLPFRPEFILERPKADPQWLLACYNYFREIVHAVEKDQLLNVKVLSTVLQKQFVLRLGQMPWFGLYPAWFTLRHRLVSCSIFETVNVAMRVLVRTNIRALRILFKYKLNRI